MAQRFCLAQPIGGLLVTKVEYKEVGEQIASVSDDDHISEEEKSSDKTKPANVTVATPPVTSSSVTPSVTPGTTQSTEQDDDESENDDPTNNGGQC